MRDVPPDESTWELSLDVGLDQVDDSEALRHACAVRLRRPVEDVPEVIVRKRSIDARRGRVRFHLIVGPPESHGLPSGPPLREVSGGRVVIIGGGPGGLFCAHQLARHGIASIVVERGHPVQRRRRDLKAINQKGVVDPDSNYCFGEGGAGTYSDGKLYTRAHKRGDVRDVLETLVTCGAPRSILIDARPHIGSNRLPKVVSAMRERLEAVGVEFRFGATVADLDMDSHRRVRAVMLRDGAQIAGVAFVIAAGHSARDMFEVLASAGAELESKSFALGVRVEHPQPLIDSIQYGKDAGHPRLPAASYRLAHRVQSRGVFSFCMCPGGWIVPSATQREQVVVNGMSLSRRDSPFANSGIVTEITPADVVAAGFAGPRGGLELQRTLEESAFTAGGGALQAPATRLSDFVDGRGSTTVGASSYIPGLSAGDVGAVFDSVVPAVASRLRTGLRAFERRLRGYLTEEAVVVGVESRTSSPVRVRRHPDALRCCGLANVYPCGEGAGFAGGIMSAALDGMRVANALAQLDLSSLDVCC